MDLFHDDVGGPGSEHFICSLLPPRPSRSLTVLPCACQTLRNEHGWREQQAGQSERPAICVCLDEFCADRLCFGTQNEDDWEHVDAQPAPPGTSHEPPKAEAKARVPEVAPRASDSKCVMCDTLVPPDSISPTPGHCQCRYCKSCLRSHITRFAEQNPGQEVSPSVPSILSFCSRQNSFVSDPLHWRASPAQTGGCQIAAQRQRSHRA